MIPKALGGIGGVASIFFGAGGHGHVTVLNAQEFRTISIFSF